MKLLKTASAQTSHRRVFYGNGEATDTYLSAYDGRNEDPKAFLVATIKEGVTLSGDVLNTYLELALEKNQILVSEIDPVPDFNSIEEAMNFFRQASVIKAALKEIDGGEKAGESQKVMRMW